MFNIVDKDFTITSCCGVFIFKMKRNITKEMLEGKGSKVLGSKITTMKMKKIRYSRKGCKTLKALDGSYIKCDCGCKYFTGCYCDICSKCGKRLKTEIGSGEAMKIDMNLKTLKDINTIVLKINDEGTPNKVVEAYKKELKQEAIKRVNNCCPNDNIGGTPLRKNKRCEACERDIWFYDLTEEDLK